MRTAAVSLSPQALEDACTGFHRAFPRRSAKRVAYVTQLAVFALITGGIVWTFSAAPGVSFEILRSAAFALFAIAILWRLLAAASLELTLSRIAEPAHWPIYTILCPLYREASVTPDLVAALNGLDYPGTE